MTWYPPSPVEPACGTGGLLLSNPPFSTTMTPTPPPGRFIAVEGIDGSGKTTLCRALADWLPTSGLMPPGAELVVTREPGGTPLGQEIRRLLLDPPDGAAPCHSAELLLYIADRAQHVETVILPALEAGHWVLTDRFSGSTVAYQGFGRGWSDNRLSDLGWFAAGMLAPNPTLWLDLPLAESLRRRGHRPGDRIEANGEAFLARVAHGFDHLACQPNWTRLDATQPPDQVLTAARHALIKRFGAP
jgi:dTMP kinase